MALSETDYILVGNLTKVSTALNVVRDVLPGENCEYGVTEAERKEIAKQLYNLQTRLFGVINATE